MTFRLILFGLFLSAVHCYDSGSAETNKIEMNPIYDTIIFSDVADIINDLENGMNPLETLFNSGSDSEENLEDLLSEYQHYLDRAHKQRFNYLEKSKTKNKIPLTRQDRFAKAKQAGGMKYDDYYFAGNYINPKNFPQSQDRSPIDTFGAFNQKFKYLSKNGLNGQLPKEEYPTYEKKILSISPIFTKSQYDPIKPSCFCKSAQLPCDCKCKQCLVPYDSIPPNYYHNKYSIPADSERGLPPNTDYTTEDKLSEMNDNTLNIRIKVDIQLPKTKEIFTKILKNRSHEEFNSKETTVNVPFPYFNFPIPMDLFGYKKPLKPNSYDPFHKITVHKKKKSRTSNGNKKHRKKVITFHNLNIQPQQPKIQPFFDETTNSTINYNEKVTETSNQTVPNTTTVSTIIRLDTFDNTTTTNNTKNYFFTFNNENQTEESSKVVINISNSSYNGTGDVHKTENSVETEFTKLDINAPTEKLLNLRKKREASTEKPITVSNIVLPHTTTKIVSDLATNVTTQMTVGKPSKILAISTENNDTKRTDKALLADAELVYWPNVNTTCIGIPSKNITTIILERENQKAKLNITKETIRNNRSTALEKAIFGNVNWDDVDTVAPVFLSFVGKYLKGVLTFCSRNVCHSMKCAEKTCLHRICHPNDRWNQRGHCAGCNKTDSVASLESIMDLPSNVAFEIVDILQDKLLGKLFGKMTLCINSKCITFVTVKKSFLKSKCSVKELKAGHCPNVKKIKIM